MGTLPEASLPIMIWDQRLDKAIGLRLDKQFNQTGNKLPAIVIIPKDFGTIDAAHYHMLQQTGGIKAGKSWHAPNLTESGDECNKATTSPAPSIRR